MLSEIYGKKMDAVKEEAGLCIFDNDAGIVSSVPIVASGIALALGSALSSKIDNTKAVTISFLGMELWKKEYFMKV